MSVATAITALSARIQDAYAACESRGATMPVTRDTANLSATIDSIPSGGGGGPNLVAVNNNISPGAGMFSDYITFLVDGVPMNQGGFKTNAQTVQIGNVDGATNTIAYVMSDGTTGSSNATINLDGRSLFVTEWYVPCLIAGTKILLADGTQKNIEDITYDDSLVVWDFCNGKMSTSKPIWISKQTHKASFHYKAGFESGRELKMTGKFGHRGFSKTKETFEYLPNCVNDIIATSDGEDRLVECQKVDEEVDFYNIITEDHFNLYANKVLTSCRLNNYRKFNIADMKFAKPARKYHNRNDFKGISDSWIDGLHLCEQPMVKRKLIEYVNNLMELKK